MVRENLEDTIQPGGKALEIGTCSRVLERSQLTTASSILSTPQKYVCEPRIMEAS
jgi:hypothetical protein